MKDVGEFSGTLTHLDPQTRLLVRSILFLFGPILKVENDDLLVSLPDPVIFVFNHNNYWETLPLVAYLYHRRQGKKIAFIVDWMFGRIPLSSWFVKRVDAIYTYRKKARFAVLDRYQEKADGEAVCRACLDRLQNRQSLGIFPEGTRNRNPHQLRRGRKGVGEIVLRSGAPVLPLGIDVPHRSRNGRIPGFSPITLRFGQPLTFPEDCFAYQAVTQENHLTPPERTRLQLLLSAKVTHSIMQELARVSGKEYPFSPPQIPLQAQQYFANTGREGVSL